MIQSIYKLFYQNNENFIIPDINKIPKPIIDNPFIKKYGINAKELHSTIANFELPASKISKFQRALRRKYLTKLLTVIDRELDPLMNINPMVAITVKTNKANYNALVFLIKRIINLMINEIDVIDKNYRSKPRNNNLMFFILIVVIVICFLFYNK